MKCPGCGKESQGRFCSHCGTPLQAGRCLECGARLPPGDRFCMQCGTRVGAARRTSNANSNLGWYIAAGVLAVLILAVGLQMALGGKPQPAPAGAPLSAPSPGEVSGTGA